MDRKRSMNWVKPVEESGPIHHPWCQLTFLELCPEIESFQVGCQILCMLATVALPALPTPKAMNGYTAPFIQTGVSCHLWSLHTPRKDCQVADRGPVNSSDLRGGHLSLLPAQHIFTLTHYHCHHHLHIYSSCYEPDAFTDMYTLDIPNKVIRWEPWFYPFFSGGISGTKRYKYSALSKVIRIWA